MAGRNSPHGGNGYKRDGYGFGNQQDVDDDAAAAAAAAAYQHRNRSRGYGSRGYGGGGSSGYDNHRYQDTRYDSSGGGGGGSGFARRGGPEGRPAYAPPVAASINNRGGAGTSQYPARRAGTPGATRFPTPSTAYGTHAFPSPSPTSASSAGSGSGSRAFGGAAGQLLDAAGHLSPRAKAAMTLGKTPRHAASDAQATARRGMYAPSGGGAGEAPGAAASKGDYGLNLRIDPIHSDDEGEDGFRSGGRGSRGSSGSGGTPGGYSQQLQRHQQQRARHSRSGSSSGGTPTANGGGGFGVGAARSRSRSRSGSRSPRTAAPVVSPPPRAPPPENALRWAMIEGAAKRQLGSPAEKRRVRPKEEHERISPFEGCPIHGCPIAGSSGIGVGWMARHLEQHTKAAKERPQKDLYIKSTVAEILHDLCLDTEVPPSQRKFERKKMSRALFGNRREGMGYLAGIMETMVTGDNANPNVRRCALDLAAGGCDGVTGGDTIVRCDLCKAWYHISCGGMAIGDGMSTEESRDETICRTCARINIGVVQARDPSVAVQRQLAQVRERSKTMLTFLEEESRAGPGPLEGVIDLNLTIEEGGRNKPSSGSPTGAREKHGVAAASGADGKTVTSAATGKNSSNGSGSGRGSGNGSGNQGRGSNDGRPPCAAARCEQQSRTDSKYCSDSCGVRTAEAELADAVRHSLEMKGGLDRGRRVRETRELKARKQQIGIAMRKVEYPRVPGFKVEREAGLQAMTVRRLRLWQRLIEIGAYWEKVSGGSKSLAVNGRSAEQMRLQVAAANTATANVAAAPEGSSVGARTSLVAGGTGRAAANGTAAGFTEGGEQSRPEGAGAVPLQANGSGGGSSATASQAASTAAERTTREGTDRPASCPSTGGTVNGGTTAAPQGTVGTVGSADNYRASQERPSPMEVEESSAAGVAADVKVEPEGDARPTLADGEEVWTYGVLDALSVVWYCPPGGGEAHRLSSRPQLEDYWRKTRGHDRVPEHFTFRDKDAPPHWTRVGVDRTGAELRPAKKAQVAAAAAATAAAETPRYGAEFSCVYCSEATGPRVKEHLERCYRKVIARRNERLKHATLRPQPKDHHLLGGSRMGEVSVTDPVAFPEAAVINSPAAIGRQLLSRLVPYADFDELPDPSRFQLHHDLKGWKDSPSRLDFLYKELVRQRNAAVYELQALDREEAELEVSTRRDWMQSDLRSVPRTFY
eukprot:g9643.t1